MFFIHALNGSISSFFITAMSILQQIFGSKHCRYNEGPLYSKPNEQLFPRQVVIQLP